MTFPRHLLIFGLFNLWTFTRGDTEVFCQFSRTCILPCSFPTGNEVVIHWIQVQGRIQAHSYYHNQDQLALQDEVFKGRTSLYNEQISRGNASLQLRSVAIRDEGRYQCYTSTINGNKETFIQLRVYAPIEEVTIKKSDNSITCSSDGIYPKPSLTWTVNSQPVPQKDTSILQTGSLYSINSSISLPAGNTDEAYSCTISTTNGQKKTTLSKEAERNSSATEATVECQALAAPPENIIWRFNHDQLIVTWNMVESSYKATAEWEKYVKDVSNKGALTLKYLTSKQEGRYTCESSNTKETSTASTVLHLTEGGDNNTAGITIGVIIAVILAVVIVAVIVYCWRKKKSRQPDIEFSHLNGVDEKKPSNMTLLVESQTTKAAEI